MKKKFLTIGLPVFATLLVVLWIAAKLTGWLNFYTAPSESNMPAIKPSSHFFLTNLKTPKRYDFIGYQHFDSMSRQEQVYLHRLMGLPGDTLEIKGGTVFINGRDADATLVLTHTYLVPPSESAMLQDVDEHSIRPMSIGGNAIVSLPTNSPLITTRIKKVIAPEVGSINTYLQKAWHGKPWDEYNFGPIIVPRHRYFVLGDNRENAADSRYTGFIAEKDIVGVKL